MNIQSKPHSESARVGEDEKPLALHLRRLRQWHGKDGISQKDLAFLAGIPVRKLHRLETATELLPFVKDLIAIADALNTPLDALIAPTWRSSISDEVEMRRKELEQKEMETPLQYTSRCPADE